MGSSTQPSPDKPAIAAVKALNATTGELRWEYLPPLAPPYAVTGGLLSTAGGIVFGGVVSRLFALDSRTGEELWWMNAGGRIRAAPITYLSEGRQQVTVAAGQDIITFVVEEP